jgi:hypothetical protein
MGVPPTLGTVERHETRAGVKFSFCSFNADWQTHQLFALLRRKPSPAMCQQIIESIYGAHYFQSIPVLMITTYYSVNRPSWCVPPLAHGTALQGTVPDR